MAPVAEIESALGEAARRWGPAVVGIGRGWGMGSGFVFAPGHVLTVTHRLNQDEVTVAFRGTGRQAGRVLAADEDLGLAVIETDTGAVEPLPFAPETAVETGRFVLALADPGGRGLRVTAGHVSCPAARLRVPRGRRLGGAVEHTAPLPRGSSGGPLIDAEGRLLGINALRVDPGLILAIPADESTRARVEMMSRGERPRSVRLGVAVAPPRVARRLRRAVGLPDREGILIRGVQEGSPAEAAGLQRGDLIVAAAGAPAERLETLYDALVAAGPDGELGLTIVRGTEERNVEVRLG